VLLATKPLINKHFTVSDGAGNQLASNRSVGRSKNQYALVFGGNLELLFSRRRLALNAVPKTYLPAFARPETGNKALSGGLSLGGSAFVSVLKT
jgi:hypothetical protein